jgi:hypothetical protein
MSSVVLKVPDLSAAAKSALQVASPLQQQAPIQSPYAAPQYSQVKAIGDPQPATNNIKWGGYTEEVRPIQ